MGPSRRRNCLGLPLDIASTRELAVGIYQSNGLNEYSVEILDYGGAVMDFSAAPIGRGWVALRFPMRDIKGSSIAPLKAAAPSPRHAASRSQAR